MPTPEQQRQMSDIFANLERKQKAIHENLMSFTTRACLKVVATAKENCSPATTPYDRAPFITGNLRRSNNYVVYEDGGAIVGLVYNNADYAVFVHEGTSKMEGRPFLYDAVVLHANDIREGMLKAVKKGMKA